MLPATDVVAGESVYQLPAKLVDQSGQAIGLDVWKGQPTLVALFYASCPQACPLLINNIRHIEDHLPPEVRDRTRVLLVSFDPEADTPEILRKVADKHGVDAKRWRLTRTDADTVRDIAAVLGVKYRRLDDGSFNHSSVITLLDAQGRIVVRQDGLQQALEPISGQLGRLSTQAP